MSFLPKQKSDGYSSKSIRSVWMLTCVSVALSAACLVLIAALGLSSTFGSSRPYGATGDAETSARALYMQEANSRLLRERGEVQESARGAGISSFQTAPQTPDAGAGTKSSLLERFQPKQCVSLVYKKPAKSGSSTTNTMLATMLPHASVPDCWGQNEFPPIEQRLNSTVAPFDIYSCHSSYNPSTMAALAQLARHPIVHITTIREPLEQLVSLYYHKNRKECGQGELPSAERLQEFVDTTYATYLPTFQSRMYDVKDINEKLAREECSFFDVIWKIEDLPAVQGKKEGEVKKVNAAGSCPESDQMVEDQGLLDVLKRATAGPQGLYNELLKCRNLRSDFPWEWDADQGCIVTREA